MVTIAIFLQKSAKLSLYSIIFCIISLYLVDKQPKAWLNITKNLQRKIKNRIMRRKAFNKKAHKNKTPTKVNSQKKHPKYLYKDPVAVHELYLIEQSLRKKYYEQPSTSSSNNLVEG